MEEPKRMKGRLSEGGEERVADMSRADETLELTQVKITGSWGNGS